MNPIDTGEIQQKSPAELASSEGQQRIEARPQSAFTKFKEHANTDSLYKIGVNPMQTIDVPNLPESSAVAPPPLLPPPTLPSNHPNSKRQKVQVLVGMNADGKDK